MGGLYAVQSGMGYYLRVPWPVRFGQFPVWTCDRDEALRFATEGEAAREAARWPYADAVVVTLSDAA